MGQLETQLVALAQREDLCPCRQVALQRFKRIGLPAYRSEDYQRTDLSAMLEGRWQISQGSYESNIEEISWPEGSYVGLLSGFKGNLPKLHSTDGDPLQALIEGLDDHTFLVYLPKEAKVHQPLNYTYLLEEAEQGAMLLSRFIIVLEAEAELEIVGWDRNRFTGHSVSLQSTEIFVGKGAKLTLTDIEDSVAEAQRISTLHLVQEAHSQVKLYSLTLGAGRTRNNFHCDLMGEYANLSLSGVVLNTGKSHVDNFSYISHSVPHCTSDELFKYILADEASGAFTGRILVAIDAQKTQAYQNNRNLLLSPSARMQAKPQLEIYADDVKCSHGMTTGQLSSDALFYLRQRGIPERQARMFLSIAFAEDVLQRIEDEDLRCSLREQVEHHLHSIY
ncbi:Fe-S cluster assembly protein SufD [Porphyromonas sp. COT-239 OH1446]|uniref:Fe-S cluster assembly protein SufD n=1 Tax=Porphyromonas sp. COT-239 OH1446 TaxID=1515613 RepID=UPI0006902AD8|nr:Fe-S cluster assembly protein SufD [Porphyromonas sp. COT-239 OH1446]